MTFTKCVLRNTVYEISIVVFSETGSCVIGSETEITSHRNLCKLAILRWQALVFKRTNWRAACETTDVERQKHAPKGPGGSQK